MKNKGAFPVEGFAADAALEWTLARVSAPVLNQEIRLGVRLLALVASVSAFCKQVETEEESRGKGTTTRQWNKVKTMG